jgi:hypothetical protein
MRTAMTISELIAKIEAATESDRALDVAITQYLGVSKAMRGSFERWRSCKPRGDTKSTIEVFLMMTAPKFTRSIEAALTLLPEYISYELTRSAAGTDGLKRCRLWDWRRAPLMSDPDNEWKAEGNSTLPLMICAAALKVRAP